jgi:hypothetical protein
MRVSNINCRQKVENREPFTGSHLFAEVTRPKGSGLRGAVREAIGEPLEVYAVYSYGYHFPIYAFIAGVWYRNSGKYSRSTSKHQGQARPSVPAFVDMETEALQTIIRGR